MLLARYGWRSVFVFGGPVTLAMIPVVLARLPESLDFLIARRPEGALDKLNRLLARMGRPTVTARCLCARPRKPAKPAACAASFAAAWPCRR